MAWIEKFGEVNLDAIERPNVAPDWTHTKAYSRAEVEGWVKELQTVQNLSRTQGMHYEDFQHMRESTNPQERALGQTHHRFYDHGRQGPQMNADHIKLTWDKGRFRWTTVSIAWIERRRWGCRRSQQAIRCARRIGQPLPRMRIETARCRQPTGTSRPGSKAMTPRRLARHRRTRGTPRRCGNAAARQTVYAANEPAVDAAPGVAHVASWRQRHAAIRCTLCRSAHRPSGAGGDGGALLPASEPCERFYR